MDPFSSSPRPQVPDVMISYSSHDRERVMQIVQRLRAAGVSAWIDFGGIDGAQRWGEEIVNAIEACKTVILMISKTSMQSENIAKEVALAWEGGKHFLPLCLEDARIPKSMQYQLAGIQHIKLYEGDPEAKFVAVLRALVRLGVRVSPYHLALVSADLRDREQAFEWLNHACEQRSAGLAHLKTEPRFQLLHGDPRFNALIARVETLTLEPEERAGEVPAVLPQPLAVSRPAPTGPVPLWKKILWPDIFSDRDARQAASQGVWACAFVVAATFLASILTSTPGGASVLGLGWNSPIVVAVIFAPIAFGIQKMGRPAAIIGLVLCSFAALGNLNALQAAGRTVDTYENAARQYPGYQNPYLAQAQSQYYYSWFSLLISLACVGAFTNSTRGTFAYRRMVQGREAADKQDAINRQDWAAIKATISGLLGKGRKAAQARLAARQSGAPAMTPPLAAPRHTPVAAPPAPMPRAVAPPIEVQPAIPAAVTPPQAPAAVAPPRSAPPAAPSFATLIGAGKSFDWQRTGLFAAANLAAGLAFVLWTSLTGSASVTAGYWLYEIVFGCLLALAAALALRLVRNLWAALAVAAAAVTLLSLPFVALLPTFAWGDLVYREQFQQFLLLPFISTFVFLAALVLLVPRLQPLMLALWLAAMAGEIITSLVEATLRGLGGRQLPDQVLASSSLISTLLRSVVFALVFWAGLQRARRKSAAAPLTAA